MVSSEHQEVIVTDNNTLWIALKTGNELLEQVVVLASKVEENIIKSPVTIEKMDARAIQ